MAKKRGISYDVWVKKYPRGPYQNSVYVDASKTHEGHCVHCARVEAYWKDPKNKVNRVSMNADGNQEFDGEVE